MVKHESLSDADRQAAISLLDDILSIPSEDRARVRDILSGYSAGIVEGLRIGEPPRQQEAQPA